MSIKIRKYKKLNEDEIQQQNQNQQPQQTQTTNQTVQNPQPAQQNNNQNNNQNTDQNANQNNQQNTQAGQITEDSVKKINQTILDSLSKTTSEAFTTNLGEWIKTDAAKPVMDLWNKFKGQPSWESYITFYKSFVETANNSNQNQQNQNQQDQQANVNNTTATQPQQQPQQESVDYDFASKLNESIYFQKIQCINLYN